VTSRYPKYAIKLDLFRKLLQITGLWFLVHEKLRFPEAMCDRCAEALQAHRQSQVARHLLKSNEMLAVLTVTICVAVMFFQGSTDSLRQARNTRERVKSRVETQDLADPI